jgi:hypothetical protein
MSRTRGPIAGAAAGDVGVVVESKRGIGNPTARRMELEKPYQWQGMQGRLAGVGPGRRRS